MSEKLFITLARSISDLRDRVAALAREPGPAGKDGLNGKDGESGINGRDGKNGLNGKDGKSGINGRDGKDGKSGINGRDGKDGATGPMPKHEWRGTELRFQKDQETWGKWVDLRGPPVSGAVAVVHTTDASGGPGATYTHAQSSPAAVWTVAHNLGRHPSITVVDNLGGEIYPDVRYVDADIAQITHSVPLTGRAYCN